MLDRYSRATCIVGAVTCFVAAVALTPTAVGSHLDRPRPVGVAAHAAADLAPSEPIAATRDPFVARVREDDPMEVRAVSATRPGSVLPSLHLGPLQPNAGAGPFPFGGTPTNRGALRVTAVALGERASAIVEEHGATRVVMIGEQLGGSIVAGISATGVRLTNGSSVDFPKAPR